jgi:hypothetical protein
MLSRRKFFALIAGALAAPKVLLAAPLQMKLRQPGISAPNGCGGFPGWKEGQGYIWQYPATSDECYWANPPGDPEKFYFNLSPRMNFKITGITTPDEDTNGNQGKTRSARL